ncbi:purine-cytosine permease family protein [Thalassorhabdus alkalitolerans]|uniref:Purine-cytosine permease family protein n=1 Tax=Thalassorhabdus alkalitolerans TaxID=2282697 RepID=A0ABW0YFL7_9BACI
MPEKQKRIGSDDIRPLKKAEQRVPFWGILAIWVAANFVITTILTGMLFIPNISFGQAVMVSIVGSAIGAIPLALMGRIGTRTGLPTMVITRGAFGQKGAILPAVANTIVLVGWCWIQAYMAGLSLDYAVSTITGYSNINLFTILTQLLVIFIVIYGLRGIETTQKFISLAMLTLAFVVFFQLFNLYNVNDLIQMQISQNPEITAIIAFDIVVATAFSWMSSVSDYNRGARSEKGAMAATYGGYVIASTLALGLGAAVGGFSILQGMEQTYDPTVLLAQHGFGLIAAIVVFFSVLSTNAMALYSANMSLLNIIPKVDFWKAALGLGIITVLGALLKEALMANFFDFILLIATLYIPIFAIVLTDYYILKKGRYDAEEIVENEKGSYMYKNGINIYSYVAYILGAGFALYFTYISPLAIGSTILTFLVSGLLYWGLMRGKYTVKNRTDFSERSKSA